MTITTYHLKKTEKTLILVFSKIYSLLIEQSTFQRPYLAVLNHVLLLSHILLHLYVSSFLPFPKSSDAFYFVPVCMSVYTKCVFVSAQWRDNIDPSIICFGLSSHFLKPHDSALPSFSVPLKCDNYLVHPISVSKTSSLNLSSCHFLRWVDMLFSVSSSHWNYAAWDGRHIICASHIPQFHLISIHKLCCHLLWLHSRQLSAHNC